MAQYKTFIISAMNSVFDAIRTKYDLVFEKCYDQYHSVIKELFIDNKCDDSKIYSDKIDPMLYNIYGTYHHVVTKNYNLMKKYYSEAIEHNNNIAMYNLAIYYEKIEKNYDLVKKYYLMAIEYKNNKAMYNLAHYYENTEKNYDLAKKYYLMAIEHNNDKAMYNLALYYKNTEKNYDLAKKYYLMAIEHNNDNAMNNLAVYYEKIEKNYDLAKKYYLMAIEHNNNKAMNNLALYYVNIEKNYNMAKKYYLMAHKNGCDVRLNLTYSIEYNINIIDIALTIKYSKTSEFIDQFMTSFKNIPDDLLLKYNKLLRIIAEEYYMIIYRKLMVPFKLSNVNGDISFSQ